jgi:hypothetical protein
MNIGDIITVQVDPDQNDGFDTAPAIVTGIHEDGSLRLRVLGGVGPVSDTVRNYVDEDGEPYDYEDQAAADADTTSGPVQPGPASLEEQVAALSPEERDQLRAELNAEQRQPPAPGQ